jgi:uncharacterized Zn finger protein
VRGLPEEEAMSDWAGKTYCPKCGELHIMRVVTRDSHDYPKMVSCAGCNEVWGPWPSRAEFAERYRQRMRDKNRRWRETHQEEHRRRVRECCRKRRAEERAKHEFEYEWATCPTCGEEFVKNVHNQVYCSLHCRNRTPHRLEYMRLYQRERYRKVKGAVA